MYTIKAASIDCTVCRIHKMRRRTRVNSVLVSNDYTIVTTSNTLGGNSLMESAMKWRGDQACLSTSTSISERDITSKSTSYRGTMVHQNE